MAIPYKYVIFGLTVVAMISFVFVLNGVENVMPWLNSVNERLSASSAAPRALPLPPPARNYTEPCHPRANIETEVSGFASLPTHVRQFMTYRHCRQFPILVDQPGKCAGVEPGRPLLLLVVKSLSESYSKRHAIRETWGREVVVKGVQVRLLFLVGVSDNEARQAQYNRFVSDEAARHGDMLQWAFLDTFFNLTAKQVNFMHWFNHSCAHASFVYNGDDDMFLHVGNLVQLLLSYPPGDLYVGHIIDDTPPVRYPPSKYYVPTQLWPHSEYPGYVGGGGLATAGVTLVKFFNASLAIDLFPIDDVYFGMCAKAAGVAVINHPGFRTYGVDALMASNRKGLPDNYILNELICVHKFDPNEIMVLWQKVEQQLDRK